MPDDDTKRDEVLKRLLKTPPQPKKTPRHKKSEPGISIESAKTEENGVNHKKKF